MSETQTVSSRVLEENLISSAIVRTFTDKLLDHLVVDAALVGGGPSGLVAAAYLAEAGLKTAVFERKLTPGGGVWGGGMLFNQIVVQDEVIPILDKFNIGHEPIHNTDGGYNTVDAVEMASGLVFGALKAGAVIFNNISVEDIVLKNNRVCGLVINWTPVERLSMMVDPLTILSSCVLDGTGHPSEILQLAVKKAGLTLNTPTGLPMGEKPMWAASGEQSTVENTREYYPGLFASGMSANNAMGGYRMGPIFGGMLLSGQKAAEMIVQSLKK